MLNISRFIVWYGCQWSWTDFILLDGTVKVLSINGYSRQICETSPWGLMKKAVSPILPNFPFPWSHRPAAFFRFFPSTIYFVIFVLLCELPTRFHSTYATRIVKVTLHLYIFLSYLFIKVDHLKFTFLRHKPFPFWFQLLLRDDWLLLTLLLTVGQNQTFNCQDIRCDNGSSDTDENFPSIL